MNKALIKYTTAPLRLVMLAVAGALAFVPFTCAAQQAFSTPQAAADALVDAIAAHDHAAIHEIVGPEFRRFIPVGDVPDEDVTRFLGAWADSHKIVWDDRNRAHLAVGAQDWTLPIPIVETAQGWRFDVRAGAEEIRTRRIGRNEYSAMEAVLAYYDAQKEYAQKDRDGDHVLQYARRGISSPGKHDGLYWPAKEGEDESPLGPEFGGEAAAKTYYGYNYRILTRQGRDAPGGAYDYLIKGRMTGGFALVAWPAQYGETGVMTFLVSHSGVVYQKDLGPNTASIARKMTTFNPDATWTKVEVPSALAVREQ